MKQTELWDRLWRETKVILGIAGGITTALWIKRMIEKLSGSDIIDKDIVEHGLERKLPVPVTAPQQPASSAPPSSWSGHSRPEGPWWRTNGKRESSLQMCFPRPILPPAKLKPQELTAPLSAGLLAAEGEDAGLLSRQSQPEFLQAWLCGGALAPFILPLRSSS